MLKIFLSNVQVIQHSAGQSRKGILSLAYIPRLHGSTESNEGIHIFSSITCLNRHMQTLQILQNGFRIQPRRWLPKMVKIDRFKLLAIYCSCWRIELYNSENMTLREVDQKYLGNFEMCCWVRMELICWTNCLKNKKYKESGIKEYYTHNNMKES